MRRVRRRATRRSWLSLAAGIVRVGSRRAPHQPGVPGAAVGDAGCGSGSLSPTGDFIAQFLDSATLFVTGFALALVVGMPARPAAGARARRCAIALEPYIMILYATPMVALIPFILSLMGFGFVPKVLVVFLFAVFPILYNTVEGARSIKPELIEVARSFRSANGRCGAR